MRKIYGLTPPIWIFLITLLLIVFTSGMVGGSTENVAALPLSILVLGFVLYKMWTRYGDDGNTVLPPAAENPSGPVPAQARTSAPEAPESAEERTATAAPTKPAAAKKTATKATAAAKAPAKEPAKKDDLSAAQSKLLRAALSPADDVTKDQLGQYIDAILGIPESGFWKPAAADDLELLARSLAIAALCAPPASAYRAGLRAAKDEPAPIPASVEEETKKALHEYCADTLKRDLRALAGQDSYPKGVTAKGVADTAKALEAEDALGGLARCSKAALARLAVFLGRT